MNLENFIVRPQRRSVERFSKPEAWSKLSPDDITELGRNVAGLPSTLPSESPEAKQFDLLILRTQLTLLRGEPGFETLREKVQIICHLLEEQIAIPAVARKMSLIQEVQGSSFWEGMTIVELERVRKGLRDLVQFIDRRRRATVVTDFDDEMGDGTLVDLPGTSVGVDLDRFREKARAFLRPHENDSAIHKLRFNESLSQNDLAELERIFEQEGSTPEELEAAKKEDKSLGLFVRSLVGLDRQAAKEALSSFVQSAAHSPNQIEFTNIIVNHLASRGWIELNSLYSSPFTDLHPLGIDGLFDGLSTGGLLAALDSVRRNALGPVSFP
jgi:type I restriction enzyme R subunit